MPGSIRTHRDAPADGDSTRLAANGGLASVARALDNPDAALRARAVAVLCELADVRAREVLKTMLLDPSAMVRCAAVRAAARVRTTDVLASLIVALNDPDAEVRATAVEAVSGITGRHLSCQGPEGGVDPSEIEDLKRWWRETRCAELVRFGEP
jgi:HEAT repeat protein